VDAIRADESHGNQNFQRLHYLHIVVSIHFKDVEGKSTSLYAVDQLLYTKGFLRFPTFLSFNGRMGSTGDLDEGQ